MLQQGWDAGISICPQSSAIALQHARSSSVSRLSGSMQAISGTAWSDSARARTASLTVHFTIDSIASHSPSREICDGNHRESQCMNSGRRPVFLRSARTGFYLSCSKLTDHGAESGKFEVGSNRLDQVSRLQPDIGKCRLKRSPNRVPFGAVSRKRGEKHLEIFLD